MSKRHLGLAAATAAFALCVGFAPTGHAADKPFTLSAGAFRDGTPMPKRFAGNVVDNPNCDGKNISPALSWSNAPEGIKSFAIIMIDPDGQKGLGVMHWIAYGIPGTKKGLKEGEASVPTPDIVGGINSRNTVLYAGPCPPHGLRPHHYVISLIATDLDPGALQPGMTRDALMAALKGHTLDSITTVGTYAH
jgi:Raf kinase inhibitor-like YbhB/YbcL family protein